MLVSFQHIQNIFSDTNRLYQHLFKVSNTSLQLQFHIQQIHQIMNDLKQTKSNVQIKMALSQVSQHDSEVLNEFTLISKRYLGKKEVIDNVYQLIINWRRIRQDIFDFYLQKVNGVGLMYAEQENNKQVTRLQREIVAMVEFAINITKVFTERSKSNFSIVEKTGFLFFFFLLSMQLLLFKMFKKDSIKEKIKC